MDAGRKMDTSRTTWVQTSRTTCVCPCHCGDRQASPVMSLRGSALGGGLCLLLVLDLHVRSLLPRCRAVCWRFALGAGRLRRLHLLLTSLLLLAARLQVVHVLREETIRLFSTRRLSRYLLIMGCSSCQRADTTLGFCHELLTEAAVWSTLNPDALLVVWRITASLKTKA